MRSGVRAARRRAARTARATCSTALDARVADRSLRVLLVPAHRPRDDEDQHAPARERAAAPAAAASASGSTTSSSATACTRSPAASARRCPPTVPAHQPARPSKVWGDREFTDALAPRCSRRARSVRFREMEYALPVENVRPAFDALRALIDERGWRISFPSRCASPPRTTSGSRPRTAARRATSPCTATGARTPPSTSRPSSRSCCRLRRTTALGQDAHPGCRDPPRAIPPVRRLRRPARPARPRSDVPERATSTACSVSNG